MSKSNKTERQQKAKDLWYDVKVLRKIYKDFLNKRKYYQSLWEFITKTLLHYNECFHSLSFRVKDPDSLIEKIIYKWKHGEIKYKSIAVENYEEIITDLLWIRILLLDRTKWRNIHDIVVDNFNIIERIAYCGSEEDTNLYWSDAFGLTTNWRIELKNSWYSSLHYILKSQITKDTLYAEIQVRSLLEEARWEVDHLLSYKNKTNNDTYWRNVLLWEFKNNIVDMNNFITTLIEFEMGRPSRNDVQYLIKKVKNNKKLNEEEKKKSISYIEWLHKSSVNDIQNIDFSWFNKNLELITNSMKFLEDPRNPFYTLQESIKKIENITQSINKTPGIITWSIYSDKKENET